MTGDETPKKKTRGLLRIVGSFLSLAALTYIAIALISGRDMGLSWIKGLFASHEPVEMANEYIFDVGSDRVFADLGGPLASVGTLGVQVLDAGGSQSLRDPLRMSRPAIAAAGGRAIAFDIGGTAVRGFDKTQIAAAIETDSVIISASINGNGWFCVCTQGTSGYKGVVTVYNNKGSDVYKVSLSSGYILSAALSPDNKSLSVLNLTGDGSTITFYHGLNGETADSAFALSDELILDISYPPSGDLVAISTQSLIAVNKNGEGRILYDFSGRRLSAYTLAGGFYSLHLLDFGVGYKGRLVTIGENGSLLGEYPTDRELISMSCGGGYLAVLRNDGPVFFNEKLEEFPSSSERVSTSGVNKIIALGGGSALAAGEHAAVVCRIGASS